MAHGKLISAAELDLLIGIPPAVLKLLERGQWNTRCLAEEVTAHQAENSWLASRSFNYNIFQLQYFLRWRPLIHPRHALPTPQLLYIANCGRGLVPKDAESMGREGKPLLDFNSKITQHRRNHDASFTQTTGIR